MIGDMVSKVVLSFEADTSDLKKGLKDLQAEEKKLAEEQLKQAEARNKHLEQWKSGLVAVGAAIGVAGGIAKFMWDDYKERAEESRLQTAALGVDLDLLSKATLGTKNQMELLGDAAKMNNGIFKLTSEQMMVVERAMIALNRKGYESAEVHKKVLDAVTQLKIDGLRDLGLVVDKAGLSMETAEGRAKIFANTIDTLTGAAKTVTNTQRTMAEETEHAVARMSDSWRKLKNDWITGSMVSVGGVQVDVTAYLMDGDYARKVRSEMLKRGSAASASGKSIEQYTKDMDAALAAQSAMTQQANALASQYPFDFEGDDFSKELAARRERRKQAALAMARKERAAYDKMWNDVFSELISEGAKVGGGSSGEDSGFFNDSQIGANYAQPSIGNGLFAKYGPGGLNDTEAYNQYRAAQNASFLEKTFGPIEEFDLYADAFQALNGAIGSAFSAWIDGSMSAGQAFKKFIAEALKGLAVQMAMEAVKHGAYALGSLAFGNFAGAAAHGKAAAGFAAGAVAAGLAAKQLGGGGQAPSTNAPGGGVPAYSGGQNQNGGPQTAVVVYGNDYSQDSARQRQLRAAKVLEDAKQAGGLGGPVYA